MSSRTWDYIKIQKNTIDAVKDALDEANVSPDMIIFFGQVNDKWVVIYCEYNEVSE